MVLHNNKWDRKSKIKYLRKHGIPLPVKQTPVQPKYSKKNRHSNDTQGESLPGSNSIDNSQLDQDKLTSTTPPHADDEATDSESKPIEEQTTAPKSKETPDTDLEETYYPEFEDNDELDQIISNHMKSLRLKHEQESKNKPPVDEETQKLFKDAHAKVERSKLNTAVRTKIGKKLPQNFELESDDDFDEFMDTFDHKKPLDNRTTEISLSSDALISNEEWKSSNARDEEHNDEVLESKPIEEDQEFLDNLIF